jgi:hypothetical protein
LSGVRGGPVLKKSFIARWPNNEKIYWWLTRLDEPLVKILRIR